VIARPAIAQTTNRLFLADLDAGTPASEDCLQIWTQCTPDEQMVLIQIAREHVANPYQRPTVASLLRRGVLRLDPDVELFSKEFDTFLQDKRRELQAEIAAWQGRQGSRELAALAPDPRIVCRRRGPLPHRDAARPAIERGGRRHWNDRPAHRRIEAVGGFWVLAGFLCR